MKPNPLSFESVKVPTSTNVPDLLKISPHRQETNFPKSVSLYILPSKMIDLGPDGVEEGIGGSEEGIVVHAVNESIAITNTTIRNPFTIFSSRGGPVRLNSRAGPDQWISCGT